MASLADTKPLFQIPSRRCFLWTLASLGLTAGTGRTEKGPETVYRFLTPECEVQMSVQYFPNFSSKEFRFRDRLTNRAFCLSASGEENHNCLPRFSGSMAIAFYHFRSRIHSQIPLSVKEHVTTIDHDARMNPRPPFERVLAVERDAVSDIQAFGYSQNEPEGLVSGTTPFSIWCLLRQDLYFDEKTAPFLTTHWKHTVNLISLVDVIPGDRTEWISK
jgi:hypothetical protein